MYVSIRIYRNVESKEEVATRVRDGLIIPHGRHMPGFRGWYPFDAGNGKFGSVTMFDSEAAAHAYNERANAWVADNDLSDLLPEDPEMIVGRVITSVEPG